MHPLGCKKLLNEKSRPWAISPTFENMHDVNIALMLLISVCKRSSRPVMKFPGPAELLSQMLLGCMPKSAELTQIDVCE